MNVPLPSGPAVTLRAQYTHRMERAFKEALSSGMQLAQRDGEVVVEHIQAGVLDTAAEAVLPLLVEKITKDGQDIPFTPDWLLDLPEKDFAVLRDRVIALRDENEARKGQGKKNR